MARKRILFVSSEMNPFLQTSSIAEIASALPQAVQQKDNEIRIFVPRFGCINERRNRLHEVVRLSGINITIDDNDNPLTIKVASLPSAKTQVYFLDNEDYFHRKTVYTDENGGFHPDNDERTIFFCKGALETVKKLGWIPDIIHCQGWMTSLIPLYLKTIYRDEPVFKHTKVVYSIFENHFQQTLGNDFVRKASLNNIDQQTMSCFEEADCPSLYIGASAHADAVVQYGGNIDPEVEKHIQQLGKKKPVIIHDQAASEFVELYEDLYDSLLQRKN